MDGAAEVDINSDATAQRLLGHLDAPGVAPGVHDHLVDLKVRSVQRKAAVQHLAHRNEHQSRDCGGKRRGGGGRQGGTNTRVRTALLLSRPTASPVSTTRPPFLPYRPSLISTVRHPFLLPRHFPFSTSRAALRRASFALLQLGPLARRDRHASHAPRPLPIQRQKQDRVAGARAAGSRGSRRVRVRRHCAAEVGQWQLEGDETDVTEPPRDGTRDQRSLHTGRRRRGRIGGRERGGRVASVGRISGRRRGPVGRRQLAIMRPRRFPAHRTALRSGRLRLCLASSSFFKTRFELGLNPQRQAPPAI